jgi:hypothetical protein
MRTLVLALAAIFTLTAATPAAAQTGFPHVIEGDRPFGIGLREGGLTAVVKVDGKGVWRVVEIRKAEATKDKPTPDEISFTLTAMPDDPKSLWMHVANGYPQTLTYEAAFLKDGTYQRTSVCQVMGGLFAVELWPFTFEAILMRNLTLGPAPKTMRCE